MKEERAKYGNIIIQVFLMQMGVTARGEGEKTTGNLLEENQQ